MNPPFNWYTDVWCRNCGSRTIMVVDPWGYLCDRCSRGDALQLELFNV